MGRDALSSGGRLWVRGSEVQGEGQRLCITVDNYNAAYKVCIIVVDLVKRYNTSMYITAQ